GGGGGEGKGWGVEQVNGRIDLVKKWNVEDIDLMASAHQTQISSATPQASFPILEQSSGQTMIRESNDELANTADVVSSSGKVLRLPPSCINQDFERIC
ncbi:MAG: hypothetical protein ACKOX2_12605, partial [Microcystaceae cyanobacterium]